MESATTFLSSPCSIRSLRCAPSGRITGACAPSFVSVRASAAGDKNKSVSKSGGAAGPVPTSNYMVPLDKLTTGITRPLVEILRDLNKRVPDNILSQDKTSIPWYHANRMLSFYAPGWCGEVRDVKYSDNGSVSVVYRVTIRGTDGEAHREATGTIALNDGRYKDPVAEAEETAFCKACARFGFGLYLYHEDE
ncbi:hypothetical protein FCM35_KLT00254 [Carex littledalei]|uniref:Cobalt ion binding protein n=1 Tax=Carex littledalei TaxID=544730 RepID=A0A833RTN1_9POAL|nr:hypothetical protein FCM35_KLT00254 [Carex littledalei]